LYSLCFTFTSQVNFHFNKKNKLINAIRLGINKYNNFTIFTFQAKNIINVVTSQVIKATHHAFAEKIINTIKVIISSFVKFFILNKIVIATKLAVKLSARAEKKNVKVQIRKSRLVFFIFLGIIL
jgi:hypothetical protein